MRKLALLTSAVVTASLVFPAIAAAGSPAKKPPPVDLEGKVNSKGTKAVKKRSIAMKQDDFSFGPTFVKAKPGTTIKVKLENEGNASHTFTVDSLDIDEDVAPGKKATVKVAVPDRGFVAFYCRFHVASGMQGAVFTKAGSSSSPAGSGRSDTPSTTRAGSGPYGY